MIAIKKVVIIDKKDKNIIKIYILSKIIITSNSNSKIAYLNLFAF